MKPPFFLIFLLLAFFNAEIQADNSCDSLKNKLIHLESQVERLNTYDPDFIPLHRLLAIELITELNTFSKQLLKPEDGASCFSYLLTKSEKVLDKANTTYEILEEKNKVIETIFYENATHEFLDKNYIQSIYLLDRALEYNPYYPDALMLKTEILLQEKAFEQCVTLMDVLYNQCELDAASEEKAIILSNLFYARLYETGDALVKNDHAAAALEMFQFLENCKKGYMNPIWLLLLSQNREATAKSSSNFENTLKLISKIIKIWLPA